MNMRRARSLLLATAAIVSCGKGGSGTSTGDAGIHGPTDLVVTWTLAGAAGSTTSCMAHGAAQIYLNLSGTIDPTLHQTQTVDCSLGTLTFSNLLVEDLGMPLLEGTLLDDMGTTVATVDVTVTPMLGMTSIPLAFFAPLSTGGSGGTSASSSTAASSSHAASSSGGTGGAAGSSSSGGGGASSASSAASSGSSSGIMDAGASG
jgi:hypothetical protein